MQAYLVQLSVTWTKIKDCHVNHGNRLHWTDLGTEYKVVVGHGAFTYICTITKTDPRSADQIDFEDNYKE